MPRLPAVLLALAVLALALPSSAPADEPPWKAEIAKLLAEKKVTLDFADATLPDVLAFLREVSGANFVLDPGSKLEEEKVTLKVRDLSLANALKLLLAVRQAEYRLACGTVVVGTQERLKGLPADSPAPPASPTAAQKAAWEKGAKKLTVNFASTPLTEVTAFIRDLSGLNLIVDPKLVGAKLDLALKSVTILQALTLAAHLAGGQLAYQDDVWVLKPAPRARSCGPCAKELQADWKFCPWCGKAAAEADKSGK